MGQIGRYLFVGMRDASRNAVLRQEALFAAEFRQKSLHVISKRDQHFCRRSRMRTSEISRVSILKTVCDAPKIFRAELK